MQSLGTERSNNRTLHSAVDAVTCNEFIGMCNNSSYNDQRDDMLDRSITHGFILVICCMGFLGNGIVIWLLGFHIKRKPFNIYILNLAVADFAFLLSLEFYTSIQFSRLVTFIIAGSLLTVTYNTGQLLLTAISIDRCVSVLFPIWHRCARPTHLSTTICALIWVTSFLLCVILFFLTEIHPFAHLYQYFLTGLLCLPLMTISSVILFIKVCFKSHPQKRGRLLTIILVTLLFFLFLAFPLNALLYISYVGDNIPFLLHYAFLCASLNSSVNPFLYFLLGRRKGDHSNEGLMVILQRVLNEEENDRQEVDPPSNALRNLS